MDVSIWMEHKEGWGLKNWCFQVVMLEKTLESSLDCKEIKQVTSKGNQPWLFIGRTDAEAEAPILWPPEAKSPLMGRDPDAGKDGRLEEKGTTEDELVGWHHWFNGHEFEQALGDGEGQGRLRGAVHGVTESLTQLSDWTTTGRKSTGNTVLWRRAERVWLNTGCLDSAPALPPPYQGLATVPRVSLALSVSSDNCAGVAGLHDLLCS